jgi:hypothetical protein
MNLPSIRRLIGQPSLAKMTPILLLTACRAQFRHNSDPIEAAIGMDNPQWGAAPNGSCACGCELPPISLMTYVET